MIDRLKQLSSAHVWLLSIAISVVMTECIVGGMGILLKGELTRDYFLTGLVASLFVAGLAGGAVTYFLARQKELEAKLHIAVTAREAQEYLAVTDTPVQGNAERLSHYVATPHDLAESKASEQQSRNGDAQAGLKRAIKNLDVLPAIPVIAQKLLALNLDTEAGEQMLLVLIGQDPQISAKILGLANSAMVGAARQITTVREAATLLGSKRVQSVATGIAIISLMTKRPTGEFNIHDLWLHGFRVAFAMQVIARFMPEKLRPSDDQTFLAGMLHDIGYMVLAYLDPKLSDKLHNHLAAEPERPALEVEREILGICHDELGAELARHWNLPEKIIAVLRFHHNPDAVEAAAGQPLVRMVNIAEKLLSSFGIIEYVTPDISAAEWEALGISPSSAAEVKTLTNEQAEQAIQFASSFS